MGLILIRQGPPGNATGGPPPGVTGGGDGPPGGFPLPTGPVQDRGMETVTVVWVLTAAATVFLALRIYCKAKIARGMWWDDYVLIVSWV